MAKKTADLTDIFAKTEAQAGAVHVPAAGRTLPTAVGLKESEVALLDQIAAEHKIARNALMRWAVRFFLRAYLAGDVDLAAFLQVPPEPRRHLEMP